MSKGIGSEELFYLFRHRTNFSLYAYRMIRIITDFDSMATDAPRNERALARFIYASANDRL